MSKTESQKIVYVPGGPVQATLGGLYIPRQADSKLLELCESSTFTYILTPRQMGKSSLMLDTVSKLDEKGIKTAVVDLQSLGGMKVELTAEEWYLGILTIIAEHLLLDTDIITWWQAHNHLGITQRTTLFFQKILLAEISAPIVIFVDEIDTTLNLNFTDDFFAAIRYLYNSRAQIPALHRLSFVLIGVAAPGDLIKDRDRTPFNIGQRVDLTDFTTEEALPLAGGLNLSANENAQILNWVMEWTSGHPNLTQRILREIAGKNKTDWSKEAVDNVVAETFFGEKSREDLNLQFVRNMLTHSDRVTDTESLLTTYREILRGKSTVLDDEQSVVMSHLKLSGVVCNKGGVLRVRNAIYRHVFNEDWINSHLPVNWKRRLAKVATGAVAIFLLALIPLSIYALISRNEAIAARNDAEIARDEEKKQRELAENQSRELAEKSEKLDKAYKELSVKSEALINAKEETENALANETKAKKLAEERRQQAELAAENEKIARAEAEQGRKDAEEATERETNAKHQAEDEREKALKSAQNEQTAKVEAEDRRKEAIFQNRKANNALRTLYTEFGAQQLNNNNPFAAAVFLNDAYQIPIEDQDQDKISNLLFLLGRAMKPIDSLLFSVKDQDKTTAFDLSPDGKRVIIGKDREIRVVESETGKNLIQLDDSDAVMSAKFSSDGKKIVVGNKDKAKIWDAETGSLLATLEPKNEVILGLFFPDGKKLMTLEDGDGNGIVSLWDIETGKLSKSLKQEKDIISFGFSSDGKKFLTVSSNGTVKILDVETEKEIPLKTENKVASGGVFALLKDEKDIRSADFSPDGKWIKTVSSNNTIKLWNAESQNFHTFMSHADTINTAWFSTDGKKLVTASNDETVKVWDIGNKDLLITLNHKDKVLSAKFSADGKRIVTASGDKTVKVWDAETGDLLASFNHPSLVTNLRTSSNGKKVITLDLQGTSRLWDVEAAKFFISLKHEGSLSADFSSDRKTVATAGTDYTAKIWDVETERLLATLNHNGHVYSARFSTDVKKIITASEDKTAKIWDAETGKLLIILNCRGHVFSAAFSRDGKKVATADINKTAKIWDAETGKEIVSLEHSDVVNSAEFSPDGKKIITASKDKTAKIWDAETGKLLISLNHENTVRSAKFSSSGNKIVTAGSDKTAKIWDAETGKEIVSLKHSDVVNSAEFSPDGKMIVTASDDKTVKIWDAVAGKILATLNHSYQVLSAKFSSDGKKVVTAGKDITKIWDVAPIDPESRSPAEINKIVEKKVPFRQENGVLESIKPN